jgi:hypothetical protein
VFTGRCHDRMTRHQLKAQAKTAKHLSAARLREKVGPATAHARENAALAAESAREWASPRVGRARERGIEVAAPKVEAAAEALAPRVDAARDKIVEELLPRLVAAATAAAAAAAARTEAAHDRSLAALAETSSAVRRSRHDVEPERTARRSRTLAALALFVAAAAAGFAAWKRSQPTEDKWATGTGGGTSSAATSDRLSGGDGVGGLGAGTLASESTDVDTPPPDGSGVAQAEQDLAATEAGTALDSDLAGTGTTEVPGVPGEGAGEMPPEGDTEGTPRP